MNEQVRGRLSFLSTAIINIPNDYRKLIKIVKDNENDPEFNRVLDILTETMEENIVSSKTKTRDYLNEAASRLTDFGNEDEQEVGRALLWAICVYNSQSRGKR